MWKLEIDLGYFANNTSIVLPLKLSTAVNCRG